MILKLSLTYWEQYRNRVPGAKPLLIFCGLCE